jgi:hypothetical protein
MFSIILPTMWRDNATLSIMLPHVHQHPLVSEILVINNDQRKVPHWFSQGTWSKVKIFTPSNNIYVNPAWNMGIKNAQQDQVCLMSDDVSFDVGVFDFLDDKLSAADSCVGPKYYKDCSGFKSGDMGLEPTTLRRPTLAGSVWLGYGSLLFLNRANFVPIPDDLKIFFGDDWILDTHKQMGKWPRKLVKFRITTNKVGTTSYAKEFEAVKEADKAAHDAYLSRGTWPFMT